MIHRMMLAAAVAIGAAAPAVSQEVLSGTAAFGGYENDAPGLRRLIRPEDLPEPFAVYVTVRPGRRSRVWNTSSTVRQQLEAIQAPSVESGPIAIGLRSRRFAPENINESLPEEWAQAVREISARTGQTGVSLDETLDYVWP